MLFSFFGNCAQRCPCFSYLCVMANYFSSSFTLGILGGGQLGKMLLYETRKFDIATRVLDPSAEAPCRIACDNFEQGDLMDFDTVYSFGKKVDVLTFEIESVNVEALEKLEKYFANPDDSGDELTHAENTLDILHDQCHAMLKGLQHHLDLLFHHFKYRSHTDHH